MGGCEMIKGYELNLSVIDEGYLFSRYVCSAENKGKAKSNLLKQIRNEGMKLRWSDDEINFLNIPVIRNKEYDMVEYNGDIITKSKLRDVQRSEKHAKELQDILNDEKTTHCYIKKRGVYYSENYNGYTEFKVHAGVYPKLDACKHAKGCEEVTIVPIVNTEHNDYLNNHIERIKSRLL